MLRIQKGNPTNQTGENKLTLLSTILLCLIILTIAAYNGPRQTEAGTIDTESNVSQDEPAVKNDISYSIEKLVENQETSAQTTQQNTDIYFDMREELRHVVNSLVEQGVVFQPDSEWGLHTPILYDIGLSDELQYYTYELCCNYGIGDYYDIIISLIYTESKFDEMAKSKTSDYGLMQINKTNHNWMSDELGITDYMNPYQNILAGVHYISEIMAMYPDDIEYVILAYNKGPTGAKRYREQGNTTNSYVIQIIEYAENLQYKS